MPNPLLGLFNIGGGEIILILILLLILLLGAVALFGLIYLIVRAAQNRSQPAASPSPAQALVENQRKKDMEHIKLLSIFHFVFAGLALLGIAFLFVHYFMIHTIFSSLGLWKAQKDTAPPPRVFLDAFVWFYVFMETIMLIACTANVLSGLFLWKRRYRIFSIVVGGLDCLQIPFGTAVGVFTILVLSRDSVQELYAPVELRPPG